MTACADGSAGDHAPRNPRSREALAHGAAFDMGPGDLRPPVEDVGGG